MTRALSAAFLSTLVSASIAAAQPPDPAEAGSTRLLVGPTARALEQGQFYVDFSAFVGGPFAQVGVTDRLSIGAGTPVLIPGVRPGDVMVITPKAQVFDGPRTDVSVGLLQFVGSKVTPAGIAYGVVTRGSPDAAITGGAGLTYAGGHHGDGARTPVVMLGGEKRVTPRLTLLTENYAASGFGFLCGGVRLTRGRGSFDLGVASFLGAGYSIIVPIFRVAFTP